MNKTYILSIQNQQLAQKLSRYTGRVYSKTVSTVKKIKRSKDIWLNEFNMKKLIKLYSSDFPLHSQTKQAIIEQYFNNLDGFFNACKNSDTARPPYRTKKYNKVVYKKSAIKYKEGRLRLSNGGKGVALIINVPDLNSQPKYAEIIYHSDKAKYMLHVVVDIVSEEYELNQDKVLSIDPGIIHPMVVFDGKNVKIYNGGKLNSYIRYRNKELASLQNKISRCQKGSKRWRKLNRAKQMLLSKSRNKIKDVLQKYTSHLVS